MNSPVFAVDKPEDSPGFLLWQTTITWQRLIKKVLDSYAISHAQFVILAISLWFETRNQQVTQSLITQQSKLDKMTVSKSLKKLAAQNLLKRGEYEQDTRIKSVYLTKKGKELTAKLVSLIEEIDAQFFGTLNKSTQHALIAILNNLVMSSKIGT